MCRGRCPAVWSNGLKRSWSGILRHHQGSTSPACTVWRHRPERYKGGHAHFPLVVTPHWMRPRLPCGHPHGDAASPRARCSAGTEYPRISQISPQSGSSHSHCRAAARIRGSAWRRSRIARTRIAKRRCEVPSTIIGVVSPGPADVPSAMENCIPQTTRDIGPQYQRPSRRMAVSVHACAGRHRLGVRVV